MAVASLLTKAHPPDPAVIDLHTFSEAVADPRFPMALGIAAIAGLVRGFSGFGSALIYMPLISAVYDPKVAAGTLLLVDGICTIPFTIGVIPHANKREVLPVSIAGAIALPFGAMLLVLVDTLTLRWVIAALVLIALLVLAAGWRYHGKPTLAAALVTGALSGLGGGALQIGAPPLLVFWLGGNNSAVTVRANIMVYFLVQAALSFIAYALNGVLTVQTIVLAILFAVPFTAAMWAGSHWFHGSSDALYRRIAYVIIGAAGILSLPILDGVLR